MAIWCSCGDPECGRCFPKASAEPQTIYCEICGRTQPYAGSVHCEPIGELTVYDVCADCKCACPACGADCEPPETDAFGHNPRYPEHSTPDGTPCRASGQPLSRRRMAMSRRIRPFSYSAATAPSGYTCSHCAHGGIKLWREHQTAPSRTKLYCAACALKDQNEVGPVDREGYIVDADGLRCDQIGWLVPAVPTMDGETFWGYTSVPEDGVLWWRRLPTYAATPTVRE